MGAILVNFDYNVLLIEDDFDLADLIITYFRQNNIGVIHYECPIEALDVLKQNRDFKAVITDLNLPNISGLDFIQRARMELGLKIPILLITISKEVDVAVKAIELGANDFVVKPLHFPQLLISTQRAIRLNNLSEENVKLKHAVNSINIEGDNIIGRSPLFLKSVELAKKIAHSSANVLITGESGSGKEVFARAIHNWGARKAKPFVAINCSAIPESLLESELFGHAKGSFTGAIEKKIGLFEEADGGTLFLDEIGDLDFSLQAKILRVIQDKKIKKVGENTYKSIDLRLIAATHKNLVEEISKQRFREDLYFRLNVIPIRVPALRERKEDVLPLAQFFLNKYSALNDKKILGFDDEAQKYILSYDWPGNVRELENAIERAVVLTIDGGAIELESFTIFENYLVEIQNNKKAEKADLSTDIDQQELVLSAFTQGENGSLMTLDDIEKKYIQLIIKKNNGAKEASARMLGIDRKTLYRKIQEIENQAAAATH